MTRIVTTCAVSAGLLALALAGCRFSEDPTPPAHGVFIGTYSDDAGTSTAIANLEQDGATVTGTLTTSFDRRASFSGTLSDERYLTGTLTYTDACGGTASVTGSLSLDETHLTGLVSADDCDGHSTPRFDLYKQ